MNITITIQVYIQITFKLYYYLSYDVPVISLETALAHRFISFIIIIVKNRLINNKITIIIS
jgi:hypothetical protein